MSRRARAVLAILAAAACGKTRDPSPAPPREPPAPAHAGPTAAGTVAKLAAAAVTAAGHAHCERLPFAENTPVPEASAAAWLTLDGKPALLVVGDSGNLGAYGIIDPDTGVTLETGSLPLSDEASDDLEGLAARGDRFYGLTSSGWIRVWRRKPGGFELIEKPYPIGPVDLSAAKNARHPPHSEGMVCDGRAMNCGRNYEGLCLAPERPGAAADAGGTCVGFAASKADGHLYCLTDDAGRLVVHRDRAIAVAPPGALADCAFGDPAGGGPGSGDDGALWAASNLFDLGHVYRITGWGDPARARVERLAALAVGFPEVIAVRGDIVYRLSDMGGTPSLMAKFRCAR